MIYESFDLLFLAAELLNLCMHTIAHIHTCTHTLGRKKVQNTLKIT